MKTRLGAALDIEFEVDSKTKVTLKSLTSSLTREKRKLMGENQRVVWAD